MPTDALIDIDIDLNESPAFNDSLIIPATLAFLEYIKHIIFLFLNFASEFPDKPIVREIIGRECFNYLCKYENSDEIKGPVHIIKRDILKENLEQFLLRNPQLQQQKEHIIEFLKQLIAVIFEKNIIFKKYPFQNKYIREKFFAKIDHKDIPKGPLLRLERFSCVISAHLQANFKNTDSKMLVANKNISFQEMLGAHKNYKTGNIFSTYISEINKTNEEFFYTQYLQTNPLEKYLSVAFARLVWLTIVLIIMNIILYCLLRSLDKKHDHFYISFFTDMQNIFLNITLLTMLATIAVFGVEQTYGKYTPRTLVIPTPKGFNKVLQQESFSILKDIKHKMEPKTKPSKSVTVEKDSSLVKAKAPRNFETNSSGPVNFAKLYRIKTRSLPPSESTGTSSNNNNSSPSAYKIQKFTFLLPQNEIDCFDTDHLFPVYANNTEVKKDEPTPLYLYISPRFQNVQKDPANKSLLKLAQDGKTVNAMGCGEDGIKLYDRKNDPENKKPDTEKYHKARVKARKANLRLECPAFKAKVVFYNGSQKKEAPATIFYTHINKPY